MDSERRRNWTSWTPGPHDAGQVDECTREEAELNRICAGLSEEEACTRAFRAMETERVLAELWRVAAMEAMTETAEPSPDATDDEMVDSRVACTIVALNLMGIETVLPGEDPLDDADVGRPVGRIHLRQPAGDGRVVCALEQLDAFSGLINEFHRSTIFVNGLRLVPSEIEGGIVGWSLTAAHPGIIAGFGEFLMHKYINDGWRLE